MTAILRTWLLFLALAGSFSTRSYASCRGFVAMVGEHFFEYPIFHDMMRTPLKLATLDEQFRRVLWEGVDNPQVIEVAEKLKRLSNQERTAALRAVENKLFIERPEGIEMMESSSAALPDEGTIVELGCGNGLGCTFLAFEKPGRDLVLIDSNPLALRTARERVEWLREEQGLPDTTIAIEANMESVQLPAESADAFIANFVLMYSWRVEKSFKLAAHSLKKNGLFVVHEPLPNAMSDSPYELMRKPLEEAVVAGGVFTELDLAIKSAFWNGLVNLSNNTAGSFLRSPSDMAQVAKEAGFELVSEFRSPQSNYYRLVFRKN